VQADLKRRIGIGVGLVNHISLQAPCRWHSGVSLTQGRRQLMLFLQQQTVVSLKVCRAHDLSSVEGNLAYGSAFYTHSNPVSATRVRIAAASFAQ